MTKHLRNLEAHVGARLLERSPRIVRPTSHGLMLYEASRSALLTIESALEGVRRDMGAIEGLLRVQAPSCIGTKHLHGITMAFQEKYPTVRVDLFLEDRNVDLVYENFDLGVKYGEPNAQDLIIRRLGHIRRIIVASPKFLERFGKIKTISDLANADLITTPAVLSSRDTLILQKRGESIEAAVRPVFRTNNAQVIINTLLRGHVAGPVQHLLVSEELKRGELIRVLPDYELKSADVFMAYPSVRFMRPAVRAFIDFVVPALKAVEGVDTDASPANGAVDEFQRLDKPAGSRHRRANGSLKRRPREQATRSRRRKSGSS